MPIFLKQLLLTFLPILNGYIDELQKSIDPKSEFTKEIDLFQEALISFLGKLLKA